MSGNRIKGGAAPYPTPATFGIRGLGWARSFETVAKAGTIPRQPGRICIASSGHQARAVTGDLVWVFQLDVVCGLGKLWKYRNICLRRRHLHAVSQ